MSSAEAPAARPEAGGRFLAELREQPRAPASLLEHEAEFARVAEAIRAPGASLVRIVGHGSSDNAASYGVGSTRSASSPA